MSVFILPSRYPVNSPRIYGDVSAARTRVIVSNKTSPVDDLSTGNYFGARFLVLFALIRNRAMKGEGFISRFARQNGYQRQPRVQPIRKQAFRYSTATQKCQSRVERRNTLQFSDETKTERERELKDGPQSYSCVFPPLLAKDDPKQSEILQSVVSDSRVIIVRFHEAFEENGIEANLGEL